MRDTEITAEIQAGRIVITPFRPEQLQGASYDLAVGNEAMVSNSPDKVLLGAEKSASLHMNAGDFALVLTKESIKLPLNVSCTIGMRSSLARRGLILLAGMQIDPGFEGHLRFGLFNASPRKASLDYDDDLCTIEFHKLSGDVAHPAPRNQDLIQGKIPETDRTYLRDLETTSLSELSRSVQSMSRSVATLATDMRWLKIVLVGGIVSILAGVVGTILKLSFSH
jgi:dCTP deaminase